MLCISIIGGHGTKSSGVTPGAERGIVVPAVGRDGAAGALDRRARLGERHNLAVPQGPDQARRSKALAAKVGWNVKRRKAQRLCQKGQKGRKGAQGHDRDPLSDLSDLSGVGAPEKSSGLTCHRWMARPSVFVVTSFSQPART